jgi:hypothetical protein
VLASNLYLPGVRFRSSEEQGGQIGQIAAPDHPRMRTGSFDIGVADIFGFEPLAELLIDFD